MDIERRDFLKGAAGVAAVLLVLKSDTPPAAATVAPAKTGASLQGTGDLGGATLLKAARVFFTSIAPGQVGMDDPTIKKALSLGVVALHISWKEQNVANVAPFLKNLQTALKAKGVRTHATWHHEPENDTIAPADYRAMWGEQAVAIRNAGMVPTLCLMGWTLQAGSGRDWHDWYNPAAIDCLAWDMYNWGNKKGVFTSPAKMIAPIVAVNLETKKPWTIAETGVEHFGTLQQRVNWAAAWRKAISDNHGALALWWDSSSSSSAFDVRLEPATAKAWLM